MSLYLDQMVARLNNEHATDLSDETIDRAIGPCIGGKKLVLLAKQYRDAGLLTTDMIELWQK